MVDKIGSPASEVYVSAISSCEISTKQAVGKLRAPDDLAGQVVASSFTELPVTIRHGLAVAQLPMHHRDPFDRVLVAQAQCEGLTLVTSDRALGAYGVPILPARA